MGEVVIIEGIDASGKSTIASELVTILRTLGITCHHADKKHPKFTDEYIQEYSDKLGALIWSEQKEETQTPFLFLGSLGWLLQLALWYNFLKEVYIPKLIASYDFVIVDGWFYKLYARMCQDASIDRDLLDSILAQLQISQNNIILKIDPKNSWARRSIFKPTEMATFGINPINQYDSYLAFQQKVQNTLLCLASVNSWYVLDVNNDSPDHITRIIANYLTKN
jgi:thymidylate kinase